jgi:hypothetical protein
VLHALQISFSLIWPFSLYLAKSTSYEALHYAILSNLLPVHPSSVTIFLLATCSQIPSSLPSPFNVRDQVSHT